MGLRGLAQIAAEHADVREMKTGEIPSKTSRVARRAAPPAPPALTADQAKLRDQLTAFIPAETLAPTTALFGYFSDYDWRVRASIVVIAAILTPLWVWINFVDQAQTQAARSTVPVLAMGFGLASYLIWVGSIPATPYLRWHVWNLQLGAGMVLISGLVLACASALVKMLRMRHSQVPAT